MKGATKMHFFSLDSITVRSFNETKSFMRLVNHSKVITEIKFQLTVYALNMLTRLIGSLDYT